jgi:hypothetical protein
MCTFEEHELLEEFGKRDWEDLAKELQQIIRLKMKDALFFFTALKCAPHSLAKVPSCLQIMLSNNDQSEINRHIRFLLSNPREYQVSLKVFVNLGFSCDYVSRNISRAYFNCLIHAVAFLETGNLHKSENIYCLENLNILKEFGALRPYQKYPNLWIDVLCYFSYRANLNNIHRIYMFIDWLNENLDLEKLSSNENVINRLIEMAYSSFQVNQWDFECIYFYQIVKYLIERTKICTPQWTKADQETVIRTVKIFKISIHHIWGVYMVDELFTSLTSFLRTFIKAKNSFELKNHTEYNQLTMIPSQMQEKLQIFLFQILNFMYDKKYESQRENIQNILPKIESCCLEYWDILCPHPPPWCIQRLLWIAYFSKDNKKCLLSKLPSEIIKYSLLPRLYSGLWKPMCYREGFLFSKQS